MNEKGYLMADHQQLKGESAFQKECRAEAENLAEKRYAEKKALGSPLGDDMLKEKSVQEYLQEMEMKAVEEHFFTCINHFLDMGRADLEIDQWKRACKNVRQMMSDLPAIDLSSISEETSMQELLGITDETCEAFEEVGKKRFHTEEYLTAVSYFFLLTLFKPDTLNYWKRLGICYHGAEYYEEALIAYENVVMIDPEEISTLLFLADCCIHLNEFEKAGGYLQNATQEIEAKTESEEIIAYSQMLKKAL